MARNTQEIYQTILDEKAKYSSLNGLTNTASTAIWKTIFYVIAVVIATYEQLQDVFKNELLSSADNLQVGTRIWYAQQMLNYQEGYELIYNRLNGRLEYPITDEVSKIIVGATCINESDTVVLKVCKSSGSTLTNLDSTQISSVNYYINDFKFAGTNTRLISLPGDLLKLKLKVKVNQTKINVQGQSLLDITKYPVEDAINTFLYKIGTETFDNEFKIVDLIDSIQSVDGVTNVVITEAQSKPESEIIYINILLSEFETYQPNAGYLQIDPSQPLRTNIIYS